MKIAWFTPFSQKSAIGRSGATIAAALSKTQEVTILHTETDEGRDCLGVPTFRYPDADKLSRAQLDAYDVLVYNMGNHLPYHRDIYHASRRSPGIVIPHDFVMQHFFAAYFLEERRNPGEYIRLMEAHYGQAGRKVVEETLARKGPPFWGTDLVSQFPLFEEVVRGATGVVAHSAFLKGAIQSVYSGPLRHIPLAYEVDLNRPAITSEQLNVDHDELLVLTVGAVNPNKRLEAVLEALHESELRAAE